MMDEDHTEYHKKLFYVILVLLLTLFLGASFYHYAENWRYLDALYFTTATMTTIGYGDITPRTDGGKIFTIFFAFVGVGLALYCLSVLATHFVEEREEFWFKRMGNPNVKQRTGNLLRNLKDVFHYDKTKLVGDEELPVMTIPKKKPKNKN